jgi:hypothetical protein
MGSDVKGALHVGLGCGGPVYCGDLGFTRRLRVLDAHQNRHPLTEQRGAIGLRFEWARLTLAARTRFFHRLPTSYTATERGTSLSRTHQVWWCGKGVLNEERAQCMQGSVKATICCCFVQAFASFRLGLQLCGAASWRAGQARA